MKHAVTCAPRKKKASREMLRTVEKLKAGDESAWASVREKSVQKEMNRFRHSGMVRKWRITEGDLLAMLFEDMVGRGKLSSYRGEGNLYGWLGKYVAGYIYRANPARDKETSLCEAHAEPVATDAELVPNRDSIRFAERCFRALWRKNPVRAYVYYLKMGEGLSSHEIKVLLGISSEANVDKMSSRFKRDLTEMAASDA